MNIRDSAVCFCVFHVQTRLAYVHCRDWGTKYAHAHMLTVNSLIRWSVGIDRSPLIFVRRFFFLSPIPCPFEIFKSTASIVVKFSSVMPCYETMFPFCISRSKGHRDVIQAPFCEITLSIISS